MERLAVGSTDARCEPSGITSAGEIHAVTADYLTLCGASTVFVFLEHEFGDLIAGPTAAACPSCVSLATRRLEPAIA